MEAEKPFLEDDFPLETKLLFFNFLEERLSHHQNQVNK